MGMRESLVDYVALTSSPVAMAIGMNRNKSDVGVSSKTPSLQFQQKRRRLQSDGGGASQKHPKQIIGASNTARAPGSSSASKLLPRPPSLMSLNSQGSASSNSLISKRLVQQLLGARDKDGGFLRVAKQSFDLTEKYESYFFDVRTQCEAQRFANEYNRYDPPKKVAFLAVEWLLCFWFLFEDESVWCGVCARGAQIQAKKSRKGVDFFKISVGRAACTRQLSSQK